ncbi:MAG: ATP-binding protein [Desulfobacterales bacterium]|nr:ATP-binding protein [Desulfobacterales bacterium]
MGLGLSVCYGFIRDHGGDIQVHSKEGEWTRFIIRLPII